MNIERLTFEEWLEELYDLAAERGADFLEYAKSAGEAWRDYYDDDYTPWSAWSEDLSYADDDER